MNRKSLVFLILAIIGTVLALFPVVFMLFTSLIGSIQQGAFLMDYFIPAEFSFVIYVGAVLLVIGVWKSPQDRKLSLYGLVAAVCFFGLILLLSVISGIDHTPDPSLGQYLAIGIPLLFFCLSSLFIGGVGIRYVSRIIFKKEKQ